MANAKETPRQKMISLMYLVLTCLLALNVSKEVLQGFVTINESIETTNSNFTNNTKKIMEAFEEAIHQGRHEFVPYFAKAKQASALTEKTFAHIDSLKKEIIKYTENVENADTLKLAMVERLDNYDKPTYFLIGSDELNPKKGKFSATELKEKISQLSDSLNVMIDFMKTQKGLFLPVDDQRALKDKLQLLKPSDNYKDAEGKAVNWEYKNFYNQPLAAVITNLSKIQGDIRNLEGELVNTFASAPGKLSVRFNQMQARIVPVSKYVQAGSPFTADVFLSAASSDFKEDNLQFILGDMDTTSGVLASNAVVLPIDGGTGKINLPGNSIGRKEISGWIKFRDGTGKFKYFKYENDYVVAKPAVAVSPDKMNVFYAGVENPITVSAAGVAPTELVVNIAGNNASLQNNGNGKYNVKVSGSGTCAITVFQKIEGRMVQQGPPQEFRVKRIPNPPLRISGRAVVGNIDMKVSEAKNIGGLGLDISSFDFDAPFRVTSFAITMGGPGMSYQFYKCEGNKLSDKAREGLSKIKSGCKIYFEDIKVQAPDEMRDLAMVKVSVK